MIVDNPVSLHAVYDFLARLVCKWLAPDYAVYGGNHEVVPSARDLFFSPDGRVHAYPAFRYRKIDVDGACSHTGQNLKKTVDWMGKSATRF